MLEVGLPLYFDISRLVFKETVQFSSLFKFSLPLITFLMPLINQFIADSAFGYDGRLDGGFFIWIIYNLESFKSLS